MLSEKRGQAFIGKKLVNIITGIMLLLLIVVVSVTLVRVFLPDADCSNGAEWKVVRSSLNQLERGTREKITIPFYNGDCPLAAFSKNQVRTVAPGSPKLISDKPLLCMCKIDEGKCDPFEECFTLTKFDEIRYPAEEGQFTTHKQRDQMFITFQKDEDSLEIFILGVNKANKESSFTFEEVAPERDSTRLLSSLKLEYDSKNDLELVSVTDKGSQPFVPAGSRMLFSGAFPSMFDLDFNELAEDGPRPLDVKKVASAELTILVALSELDRLSENERASFSLFYQRAVEDWSFSKLDCDRSNTKYLSAGELSDTLSGAKVSSDIKTVIPCTTTISGFSKSFALAPVAGGIA